jgi:serine phosphatase RsbU (regulator of sigma subunit)
MSFVSIKGDKESIGGKQKEERVYTNHEIKIEKGKRTVIYLTTDGFQDQPSPEGKKIGSKGLQEMIQTALQGIRSWIRRSYLKMHSMLIQKIIKSLKEMTLL